MREKHRVRKFLQRILHPRLHYGYKSKHVNQEGERKTQTGVKPEVDEEQMFMLNGNPQKHDELQEKEFQGLD